MRGLIGHTGFVGSNILKNVNFDFLYNSKNIEDIHNQNLQMLICAGAPGSMIEANKNRNFDKENINLLIDNISKSNPDRLILISTIGVFEDFSAFNDETSDEFETELAYGANRRYLEQSLESLSSKTHIIRLPALFGEGLKKNFIFDLLNQAPSFFTIEKFKQLESLIDQKDKNLLQFYEYNADKELYILDRKKFNHSAKKSKLVKFLNDIKCSSVFFHSHKTTYQFYNLGSLWIDICKVIDNDINIMHLSSEPITTNEIFRKFFLEDMPRTEAAIHVENMITNNSHIWGSSEHFIQNKKEVLNQLHNFYLNKSNL